MFNLKTPQLNKMSERLRKTSEPIKLTRASSMVEKANSEVVIQPLAQSPYSRQTSISSFPMGFQGMTAMDSSPLCKLSSCIPFEPITFRSLYIPSSKYLYCLNVIFNTIFFSQTSIQQHLLKKVVNFPLFITYSDIQPTNFANVEDMLFEVFRCEETDTINNIAIAQFLKVYTYCTFTMPCNFPITYDKKVGY